MEERENSLKVKQSKKQLNTTLNRKEEEEVKIIERKIMRTILGPTITP